MATTSRTNDRDDGDANPGRTGPTGQTDEVTRLGNAPGGGSSGAAESGGMGGITGGAGGALSGGPDVDAALKDADAGGNAEGINVPSTPVDDTRPATRVVGGSIDHPYGPGPAGGAEGGRA